jgi:hypothetical protein
MLEEMARPRFLKAGSWRIVDDEPELFVSAPFQLPSPIVYAIIVNGWIKYIGKTKNGLGTRMGSGGYATQRRDPTSVRGMKHEEITKTLLLGGTVTIYARKGPADAIHPLFPGDLETQLIDHLPPAKTWNHSPAGMGAEPLLRRPRDLDREQFESSSKHLLHIEKMKLTKQRHRDIARLARLRKAIRSF